MSKDDMPMACCKHGEKGAGMSCCSGKDGKEAKACMRSGKGGDCCASSAACCKDHAGCCSGKDGAQTASACCGGGKCDRHAHSHASGM